MLKKLSFLISLNLLLTGTAFGQSDMPACAGSDISAWDNCIGSWTYAKGNKYVGEWKNGTMTGQGTYKFSDGRQYIGEYKDNKYNGQGTFTFPNGEKYVGQWKDDMINGRGIFYNPDGSVQESGIYGNGKLVVAQYIDPNTLIVNEVQRLEAKRIKKEAEIAVNKAEIGQSSTPTCEGDSNSWNNCFGKLRSNAYTYIGEFKTGVASGKGVRFDNYGAKFVGEFSNGKINGQGTNLGKNGEYFIGDFIDDRPNGKGIKFAADGSIEESGIYRDGTFRRSQFVDLIQLAEAVRLREVKKAEEKRIEEIERKRLTEEKKAQELERQRLAEEIRIKYAKEAEEKRTREAKAEEERRTQEAKLAKEAEERRVWLTTPEGKKFAAAEAAKIKMEEAERQRYFAIEEAKAKKQEAEKLRLEAKQKREEAERQKTEEAERQKAAAIEEARVKKEEAERQKALIAERARVEKEELERQKLARSNQSTASNGVIAADLSQGKDSPYCEKMKNWASGSRELVAAYIGESMSSISLIRFRKGDLSCLAVIDTPKGPVNCRVEKIRKDEKSGVVYADLRGFLGDAVCSVLRTGEPNPFVH